MANFSMGRAQNYTPGDLADFNWVYASTAGNIAVVTNPGDTPDVIAIPAGVWIPVGNATLLASAGTTAATLLVV